MTLEEMREKKREYGFTNEQISDYTGVPLATVQKIFAGVTESPDMPPYRRLRRCFVNWKEKGIRAWQQTGWRKARRIWRIV